VGGDKSKEKQTEYWEFQLGIRVRDDLPEDLLTARKS
jgi:hypothetical protein